MPGYMTDLVDRLVEAGRRRGYPEWASAREFQAVMGVLADEHGDAGAPVTAFDGRLRHAAATFCLDETDARLLWFAAAPDVDANVSIAYGLLRGTRTATRVSVGLALELVGVPTVSPDGRDRLGPSGPLVRHGLVALIGSEPWLARDLQVPDPVVASLLGSTAGDPAVVALHLPVVAMHSPESRLIGRAIADGVALTWVRASAGAAGGCVAAAGIEAAGMAWLSVDLRRAPAERPLPDVVTSALRAAGLAGRALILGGADLLGDGGGEGFEALARGAVPVVAVGDRPWNRAWLSHLPLVVDAAPLTAAARALLWSQQLEGLVPGDADLYRSLAGLRFTPREVAETARYAGTLARARGATVDAALVRDAARRVAGSGGSGTHRVNASTPEGGGPGFDALVLPDHALTELHRLVAWSRNRDEVGVRGALGRRGRGISALFTGNPGTGKTLAANVVAAELSLPLFEVALSAVIDKYIGETEKNLEEVFHAAEALDAVLFFDEADALFGARSAVHDARDRYANQEIAYLLQRMDRFEGITVLATNLRGNLDRAFARRMNFVIDFPDPDPPVRRTLWEHLVGELDAVDGADPVDVEHLAADLDLTGGDIRNIVLAAAYDALETGEPVGMRHIAAAAEREYHKLGRMPYSRRGDGADRSRGAVSVDGAPTGPGR